MNSFEKLLVNSTNRISSSLKMIPNMLSNPLSAPFATSTSLSQVHTHHSHHKNPLFKVSCALDTPNETLEDLNLKYQELTMTLKQANHQKLMMLNLFDMIFQVEQGKKQKLNKRIRRKKTQIHSKYQCEIQTCKKAYTSTASLARHSKLKHAYSKFEPPSHNYQIPPSPNLNDSEGESRRADLKETVEKDGEDSEEEGAANTHIPANEDLYEADWEHSEDDSENMIDKRD